MQGDFYMFKVQKQNILVVDDTLINIDVIKGILGQDYVVQAALNSKTALKIINKRKPDLILLDIMMPEMDGYEVCMILKSQAETKDIPVVFLTAKAQEGDESKGLALGAIDYITKPISPPILKARVKNHLRLQASKVELKRHNEILEERVTARTVELLSVRDSAMLANKALAKQNKEKDKQAEDLSLAASVFTYAREGIIIANASAILIDANKAFTEITGYSTEEVIGQAPRFLQAGSYKPEFYRALWQTINSTDQWTGEVLSRRKNGEVYLASLAISVVKDNLGAVSHYVALLSDITQQKDHQGQLEQLAHYDALTKLPNRTLLIDRLNQSILQCQNHDNSVAVVFMDLDCFKQVNETHGHSIGDELLVIMAQRLKDALREIDTLARIGGDEFIAILTDLSDTKEYEPILERLLLAASTPVIIRDMVLNISVSIGVTLSFNDDDADILIRHADQAMFVAKQAGKNCFHLFDNLHDDAVNIKQEVIDNIKAAFIKDEFVLYYQPKVNMASGAVKGVEALIRWQHPTRGLVPPLDFLPFIENHNISLDIGEWVIESSLIQLSEWQKIDLVFNISVNISAYQLQQANFVERLASLLAKYPEVSPHLLELEILETSEFNDISCVTDTMLACIDLGVYFALDDFGTGYSSLTYLKRLPASLIKIDQSFVRDMLSDTDDLAIVRGVASLAKAFRLDVIAEGVETVEHGTALIELGCELAQGYGIARPMPAEDIPIWLASWVPDNAWLRK